MKNLNLDFAQRFGLTSFLAMTTTPTLGQLDSLQRVYTAVRLSEQEIKQIRITDLGNGRSAVEPPTPDFGRLELDIEDADAVALLQNMESRDKWQMSDGAWAPHVKDELSRTSAPINQPRVVKRS